MSKETYIPIGEIKNFPQEVIGKMAVRQVEQGNKFDLTIFERKKHSCKKDGGFDWGKTEEGDEFWYKIIYDSDFDHFFKKYPKPTESNSFLRDFIHKSNESSILGETPKPSLLHYIPKGRIEDFPIEIISKMVENQVLQGNKFDVSVFEKNTKACKMGDGFDWQKTEEGDEFWYNIISRKNFDRFFALYPNIKAPEVFDMYGGKIKEYPAVIVEKMLEYQVKQGNPRNHLVFEKSAYAEKKIGGFDWKETPEGDLFWREIILRFNTDHFYKCYPKPTETESKPLVWRGKSIDLSNGWIVKCGNKDHKNIVASFIKGHPFNGSHLNKNKYVINHMGIGSLTKTTENIYATIPTRYQHLPLLSFSEFETLILNNKSYDKENKTSRSLVQGNPRTTTGERSEISFGGCGNGLEASNRERRERSVEIGKKLGSEGEGIRVGRAIKRSLTI